jgi:hypothetical protein
MVGGGGWGTEKGGRTPVWRLLGTAASERAQDKHVAGARGDALFLPRCLLCLLLLLSHAQLSAREFGKIAAELMG